MLLQMYLVNMLWGCVMIARSFPQIMCSGPWKQVQKYKADSIGSEDMSEPSETQDFRGFYETSRVRPLTLLPSTLQHT